MINDSASAGYELLDFGRGRKLERFGRRVLDRPAPAAQDCDRSAPELWPSADLRFAADGNGAEGWDPHSGASAWSITLEGLTLELKPTPFGHVGLFPEHAAVWRALAEVCRDRPAAAVLNLFAHTGAATLAAAAAGARVTHVDAAGNVVRWARRNAELSGMGDRPIRWIVDDARKFVTREARRGQRYDVVLVDPPAYGHGPRGQRWSIDDDLVALLGACRGLLAPGAWLALSCHSQGYDAQRLAQLVAHVTGHAARHERLLLATPSARRLPAGAVAWSRAE